MPRIVITVVSLAAVLLHATVGCCAHHHHATTDPGQEPQACHLGHHPHDHGPAHDHSDQPIDLPLHDDCHEAHCFATLAGAVSTPDAPRQSCELVISAGHDEQILSASRFALSIAPRQAYGPLPLRAHLRFCVLLN